LDFRITPNGEVGWIEVRILVSYEHSREYSKSADEFIDVLNGRINALANTHALLSRRRWKGVGLGELVRTELAFWTKTKNALIEGPEINLAAEATQPVAMVLHELATNPAKHGALSSAHGRVLVRWAKVGEGTLKWQAGARVAGDWRPAGGSTQRRWLRQQRDLRRHPL
jgi:two-component sensor histidine kinase